MMGFIVGAGISLGLVLVVVPAGHQAAAADSANDWRAIAMTLADSGQFDRALDRFRQAAKLDPNNSSLAASAKLLEEYVALRDSMDRGRAEEYDRAVARVQRAILTEDTAKELEKGGLGKKLREKLDEAISAYEAGSAVSDLSDATTEKAAKIRTDLLADTDKLIKAVKGTLDLLKDSKSDFAETYRGLIAKFKQQTADYRKAWTTAGLDTTEGRANAIKKLWPLQYDQAAALGDIEAMTVAKPWRTALGHVRLAKELAPKGKDITALDWYKKVVTRVTRRAKDAEDAKDWHEALSAYWGLSELDTADEKLRARVRITRRHVRVLNMYGKETKPKDPENEPTDEENGVTWQEMVAGADANLVEKAIEKLSRYVSSVNYRKVSHGALDAIKVLARTPEAGSSFPKLKNDNSRKEFLDAIGSMERDIDARDRVSQMDLQLALNGVLRASEKSVDIPTAVLVVEFADGMLECLDQFSSMIWPHDVSEFQKQIRGSFVGAGIQITKDPKEPLRVVTPIDDAPAFRAGIKRGDVILAVDGRETKDLHISKLVKMITGERGTKVVLKIKREGRSKPFDVTIVREPIAIRTVKGWRRNSDGKWSFVLDKDTGVGYIRVTQFADKTAADVKRVLASLREIGVELLIFDLRFNPGGRLDSAIQIADEFLTKGPIVSTKGVNSAEATVRAGSSRGKGQYEAGKVVVLVNAQSASASEIVSGALQDLHRSTIVGKRTYGKGSVQKVYSLRWDPLAKRPVAQMKLTTAYYYLPSKRLLHKKPGAKVWGVTPDIRIPLTPKQIRYWLDIRYKTDLLQEIAHKQLTAELKEQLRADLQLNTAVLLLKLKKLNAAQTVVLKKAA